MRARILIAEDDARYATYGPLGRVGGAFLKATIGYGHQPLRAVVWSLLVIILGWLFVSVGARAGVIICGKEAS